MEAQNTDSDRGEVPRPHQAELGKDGIQMDQSLLPPASPRSLSGPQWSQLPPAWAQAHAASRSQLSTSTPATNDPSLLHGREQAGTEHNHGDRGKGVMHHVA
jgi:hypothetical protein